jgi:tetratricopeptide (TPR) repeat protein
MKSLSVLLAGGAAALAMMSAAAGQPAADGSPAALFAAGDFVAAGRAYEAAVKASPSDANAVAGLARMRLYENRNDEAIALAQRALAARPDNPVAKQTLADAQQRKAAFGPDLWKVTAPAGETVIPFVATDPLPVVSVMVGGRQANFLIDTGAPSIMVSADLAQALGLQMQSTTEGVFAGGARAPVQHTVVPEFEIGGIKFANVPAGVRPGAGPPNPARKIDGIVGTGLLMHFLSTLDYCQGRLVLRPRSASAEFERAAAAGGANVLPMWFVGDHFMFARGRLKGGPEGAFLIDTGLGGGGVSAPKATLDEAGVTIDPSRAGVGVGGGGPVTVIPFRAGATLGSLTVDDMQGFYMPSGDQQSVFPFKNKGLLSHGFFRHSRLTFDFEAMKLVTQAC